MVPVTDLGRGGPGHGAAALSGRSWQGMSVPGFLRARTLLVVVSSGAISGVGCCLLRTGGGGRSVVGGVGVPLRVLGWLAVRSSAGTVGCPYWARSVATVRGSVGGRRLLLAFGNSLGGLGGSVAVREWVGRSGWVGLVLRRGAGPSVGEMSGFGGGVGGSRSAVVRSVP